MLIAQHEKSKSRNRLPKAITIARGSELELGVSGALGDLHRWVWKLKIFGDSYRM